MCLQFYVKAATLARTNPNFVLTQPLNINGGIKCKCPTEFKGSDSPCGLVAWYALAIPGPCQKISEKNCQTGVALEWVQSPKRTSSSKKYTLEFESFVFDYTTKT